MYIHGRIEVRYQGRWFWCVIIHGIFWGPVFFGGFFGGEKGTDGAGWAGWLG